MINIRKVLLGCLMLIVIVVLVYTVWKGLKIGDFEVVGIERIEEESEKLDTAISDYEQKNSTAISSKQDLLLSDIQEYYAQKEKYNTTLKEKKIKIESLDANISYDLDFIWTKIGNYALDRNVDIELNITKNVLDQAESNYILSDLNFTVYAYINLDKHVHDPFKDTADFIDDLEKDEQLGFEIRNLYMKKEQVSVILNKGTDNEKKVDPYAVKTNFTIYNVALNKDTLTTLTSKNVTQSESLSQEGKGDVQNVTNDGKPVNKVEDSTGTDTKPNVNF